LVIANRTMDIIMPQLGETVLEGTVAAWYKKPGDAVAADEVLFEVETEKVTTEIPCPVKGILASILVPAGETVAVGTVLARVEVEGASAAPAPADASAKSAPSPRADAPAEAPPHPAAARSDSATPGAGARTPHQYSPVVRRLLAEHGIAPQSVRGSGRDGRITREDVLALVAAPGATPSFDLASDDFLVPLNKIRRATAAHMVRSVATSPHTLQAIEADFHKVERARAALGPAWKSQEGFALTYLPFVCVAVCRAIAAFPHVNASFGADALIVHRRVHLGIAVDLALEGLVAPVLRDANRLGLRELARAVAALAARARAGTLTPDELAGGTYTISNSGSFGTLITAPIINQPQVAILSTDGVHKRPVVIEGPEGDTIAIRPIGVLAQSFDHRAFDGAYSAAFLRQVKRELEERDWLAEMNGTEREADR
jgi:pyruvate dehydrogenase E2 component (dihydrolipoamide acetyltransferase)